MQHADARVRQRRLGLTEERARADQEASQKTQTSSRCRLSLLLAASRLLLLWRRSAWRRLSRIARAVGQEVGAAKKKPSASWATLCEEKEEAVCK